MRSKQSNVPLRGRLRALLAAVAVSTATILGSPACAEAADPKPDHVQKVDAALPASAPAKPAQPRKVLVYGNAQGFVHSSIPLGQYAVQKMGEKTGAFASVVSSDPAMFDADKLKDFDAVVLVSTTGQFLLPRGPDAKKATEDEKRAFEQQVKPYKDAERQRLQNLIEFVKNGNGLMGIHAATDAYYKEPGYGEMIGGYFNGHPWGKGMVYKIDDPASPLTAMFPKGQDFKIDDETYRFREPYSRELLHVLTSLDNDKSKVTAQDAAKKPDQKPDARPDKDHAVSWNREFGKGRVFYCSHGHSEHVYWNPTMVQHYLAGIQYALGDLKADATPSAKGATAGVK